MAHDRKEMKKQYKEHFLLVTKIMNDWDPYALLSGGAPKSEFEREISMIVAQVLHISSPQDAARVISRVFFIKFRAGFIYSGFLYDGWRTSIRRINELEK